MEIPLPASPTPDTPRRPSAHAMRSQKSVNRLSVVRQGTDPSNGPSHEDAKTAVQVAIRIRPPLSQNDPGYDLVPQRFRKSTVEVNSDTNLSIQSNQGKKLFVFDRVFDEHISQDGIWDYLSDSVNSFVQGYNVSILAYGQSGSGKSFTMGTSGPTEQRDTDMKGVVPRAAAALFEKLAGGVSSQKSGLRSPQRYSTHGLPTMSSMSKLNLTDHDWKLKATYVEIYNEQLRDLLIPEQTPQHERAQVSIREDIKGKILLTGLTQVDIESVDDLLRALNFGSAIRQTDATAMNATSSRSHAVFSLNLIRKDSTGTARPVLEKRRSVPIESLINSEATVTVDSKLHFVDLAGSERMKNTGAQGERAKEGISINAGLASLGKVISQLSSKQPGAHVSYRDSRLTRLLQDSLGGNAITYLIACVNPVEFHLSETLNTVTYAQRARAIQSRPEIHQTTDDGDETARIERLQAEVSSLRDQIQHLRLAQQANGTTAGPPRKEAELQDRLLDVQESYNALSQRHAKMVFELSQADGTDIAASPALNAALGTDAIDRLQRSSSLSEAVEHVILEYEKTVSSLETSLSNARSTLSNNESELIEREARIAHMDATASQLRSRLQKMSEREHISEAYLRDLESQIEGACSNEEASTALVQALKKELAQVKGQETSSEEYILTLEERLTDAEQNQDLMKRELTRLEQVIERQRSIGKLDNMLSELDHIRHVDKTKKSTPDVKVKTNGLSSYEAESDLPRGRKMSLPSPLNTPEMGLTADQAFQGFQGRERSPVSPIDGDDDSKLDVVRKTPAVTVTQPLPAIQGTEADKHSRQSLFMADKLETLTQELFDLRGEFETNVTDYDELQRKYTVALQTLAKMQDARGDANDQDTIGETTPSQAFLGDAGIGGLKEDGRRSSSRSPALDSSSRLVPTTSVTEDASPKKLSSSATPLTSKREVDGDKPHVSRELVALRQLHVEKDANISELSSNYAQLQETHQEALSQVEVLKSQLQRMQSVRPPSSPLVPMARRKPSQDFMTLSGHVDRANRSFASLRNIALENFESQPETRQNFETQLNTIMVELHGRGEKMQAMEAELTTVRRDLDGKTTMIAGLTRERSTLKATSPMDISVVGHMRDQLVESEKQIRSLHEMHASREADFQSQITTLRVQLQEHQRSIGRDATDADDMGALPQTPSSASRQLRSDSVSQNSSKEILRLQQELSAWETKHNTAMDSMKASEFRLLGAISDLETCLETSAREDEERQAKAGADDSLLQTERLKHQEIVETLQQEIAQHKASGELHQDKLAQLEEACASMKRQVEADGKSRHLATQELQTHQNLVRNLQDQLEVHKSTIDLHERNLASLKASHASKLDELQANMDTADQKARDEQASLQDQHQIMTTSMSAELQKLQAEMSSILAGTAAALGHPTDSSSLPEHVRNLASGSRDLEARHAQLQSEKSAADTELQAALANHNDLQEKMGQLHMLHEEATLNLKSMTAKEQKSSRLVEELEDQLNSSFEDHQVNSKRLSTMQSERQIELEEAISAKNEAEKELEDHRLKMSMLESQLADLRRRSATPTMRDSSGYRDSLSPEAAAISLARPISTSSPIVKTPPPPMSPTALPSPPPAIPLPPLPSSPSATSHAFPNGITNNIPNGIDARAVSPLPGSRPPSTRASNSAIDNRASAALALQQTVEEQDARIRTIEKHLFAEKQLTATLEEALVDLETAQNKTRHELDAWRKRCTGLEDELVGLRRERTSTSRASVQAVEEEREMRMQAERARRALEERMRELNGGKNKKKRGTLNCF